MSIEIRPLIVGSDLWSLRHSAPDDSPDTLSMKLVAQQRGSEAFLDRAVPIFSDDVSLRIAPTGHSNGNIPRQPLRPLRGGILPFPDDIRGRQESVGEAPDNYFEELKIEIAWCKAARHLSHRLWTLLLAIPSRADCADKICELLKAHREFFARAVAGLAAVAVERCAHIVPAAIDSELAEPVESAIIGLVPPRSLALELIQWKLRKVSPRAILAQFKPLISSARFFALPPAFAPSRVLLFDLICDCTTHPDEEVRCDAVELFARLFPSPRSLLIAFLRKLEESDFLTSLNDDQLRRVGLLLAGVANGSTVGYDEQTVSGICTRLAIWLGSSRSELQAVARYTLEEALDWDAIHAHVQSDSAQALGMSMLASYRENIRLDAAIFKAVVANVDGENPRGRALLAIGRIGRLDPTLKESVYCAYHSARRTMTDTLGQIRNAVRDYVGGFPQDFGPVSVPKDAIRETAEANVLRIMGDDKLMNSLKGIAYLFRDLDRGSPEVLINDFFAARLAESVPPFAVIDWHNSSFEAFVTTMFVNWLRSRRRTDTAYRHRLNNLSTMIASVNGESSLSLPKIKRRRSALQNNRRRSIVGAVDETMLCQLPADEAAAVFIVWTSGHSHQEAAEFLRISTYSVKYLLKKAMDRVRL